MEDDATNRPEVVSPQNTQEKKHSPVRKPTGLPSPTPKTLSPAAAHVNLHLLDERSRSELACEGAVIEQASSPRPRIDWTWYASAD